MPETKDTEAPAAEAPGLIDHVTDKLNLMFSSGVKVSEREAMLRTVETWLRGMKGGDDEAPGITLEEYPTAIRATKADLHAARKALPKLYDARKEAEELLREEIRPKHSNQPARDAAFRAQKESDPLWAETNAAEQAALDRVAALEDEVEELRGHFAVALLQTFSASGAASHPAMKPIEMILRLEAGEGVVRRALDES